MSGLTRKHKLGYDGKLYLNGSALGGGVTGGAPDEKKSTTTPTVTTPTVSTPNSSIEDALAMLNNGSHKQNADDYMNQYKNHTFNFNANALYNQYAPQYQKQARLGMEDAIGRAAALTGGYGSSFAQAVGQQAYYNQMDKLDDRILDLYNIAYGKYRDEKNDLLGMANYYNGLAQQDYDNAMALIGKKGEDEGNKLIDLNRIPEEVMQAVNAAKTNDELNAILTKYGDANVISEEEVKSLLELKSRDESGYKDKDGNPVYANIIQDPTAWTVAFDGNRNWTKWWNNKAIDRNAKITSPLGQTLSAQELIRLLKQEEMEGDDARDAVRRLLEALGIND